MTSHGHVTIRDTRPPRLETEVVAHIFPIINEPEPESLFSRINTESEDKSLEDEVEAKVVRGRRRTQPKATESAETK